MWDFLPLFVPNDVAKVIKNKGIDQLMISVIPQILPAFASAAENEAFRWRTLRLHKQKKERRSPQEEKEKHKMRLDTLSLLFVLTSS